MLVNLDPDLQFCSFEIASPLFFRFINTNCVESGDLTLKVLVAADKFGFEVLFKACQHVLCAKINVDNALAFFHAAYYCRSPKAARLKQKSLKFIRLNYDEVKRTTGFEKVRDDSVVYVKVLEAVLRQQEADFILQDQDRQRNRRHFTDAILVNII